MEERLRVEQDEQEYELHIRLVCDGAELGYNTRIEELGLTQGTRIVALDRRQRRGFVPKVMRFLHHWWPLLIIVLLMIVLIIEASGTAQQLCNRPLLTFVLLAAPLLTPYGLVLSGRFQPETGRRMLWFINHRHLARLVAVNAVVALIWFIVGAVWIFAGESTCPQDAPATYACALIAWSLLLVVNLPWALLLTMPCWLACKCECAFGIVAALAGIHRRPDRGTNLTR